MSDHAGKIVIVGAGSVGATVGYAMLIRGVARHLVLHDLDARKVHAQALDLNHGLLFIPPATIEGSDDVNICKDAAVIKYLEAENAYTAAMTKHLDGAQERLYKEMAK